LQIIEKRIFKAILHRKLSIIEEAARFIDHAWRFNYIPSQG